MRGGERSVMYALMVTPNAFPNGDAGAVRDYAFACIYKDLGFEVVHLGKGTVSQGLYRGIEYHSLHVDANSFAEKVRRRVNAFGVFKKAYEDVVAEHGLPSLIHIYDVDEKIFRFLVSLGQQLSVPVVHDSVEWYSPCQFKVGKLDYRYVMKDRLNRSLVRKPVKVIAISEFLGTYFSDKGIKTTVVPVIMDSNDYEILPSRVASNKIRLMYAGSPAAKDYLSVCVKAFGNLPENIRGRFQLDVYGASDDDISPLFDCGKLPAGIEAHGRVSRSEVLDALGGADFSLLLRPENERYARAGFPTKVVEAMMCGCPMLCNLSSDLSNYLSDGVNSVVVNGHTEKDLYDSLIRISEMPRKQIEGMRAAARRDAEQYFDYRNYRDAVDHLIHE